MTAPESLRKFPLFGDLYPAELAKIAKIIRRESYPEGFRVFSEGQAGTSMYLIEKGRVRISKTAPGHGEEALAILGPGNVFGEMAVLDGSPRSADVVVHEATDLLVIDRKDLEQLFTEDRDLAYFVLTAMIRTLANRLREMDDKLIAVFMMARFS